MLINLKELIDLALASKELDLLNKFKYLVQPMKFMWKWQGNHLIRTI